MTEPRWDRTGLAGWAGYTVIVIVRKQLSSSAHQSAPRESLWGRLTGTKTSPQSGYIYTETVRQRPPNISGILATMPTIQREGGGRVDKKDFLDEIFLPFYL